MSGNTLFGKWVLLGGFGFLILGLFLLMWAVMVWKEWGLEQARWIIVADILAFALAILCWLFWFFC